MSYHTAVTTSYDFYTALREARSVADGIQESFIENDPSAVFFPYRLVHKYEDSILSFPQS